jgi:hypothetical protein
MPLLDTGRGPNADLPGIAGEVASTNWSAEVGRKISASTNQRDVLDNRVPSSADGAKSSGSVGRSSIEYWFFCDDGACFARDDL